MPGQMSAYERNGITIDQCAEASSWTAANWNASSTPKPAYSTRGGQPPSGQGYEQPRYHDREHDDDYYRGRDKHHRRRRGFLGDLFD
jgi:Zn-finger nucleic acid-binding protein